MRESDVYTRFDAIKRYLEGLEQAIRLDSTGKELRLLGMQKLLVKKGVFTQEELTASVAEVMQEMQRQVEEQAKKVEIVKPSGEQVQVITESAKVPSAPVESTVPEPPPQA